MKIFYFKKIFSGLFSDLIFVALFVSLVAGPVFMASLVAIPKTANAQFGQELMSVPVNDGVNNMKESGISAFGVTIPISLDGLAFAAANVVIARITDSIVSWINSGFQGSPAFIQNPADWLAETADIASGALFEQLGVADFLCTPFAPIRLALIWNYNSRKFTRDYKCKLSDVVKNVENFGQFTSGNFSGKGGWDTWFSVTQNPSNNPYGVYFGAQLELDKRIANAIGLENQKLDWGKGFLSIQRCKVPDPNLPHGCKEYGPIETPGSVVESQLNNALDSEGRRIQVADEINEILSALANQLVKSVFASGLSNVGTGGTIDPNTSISDFDVTCSYTPRQNYFLDPITGISQQVVWRSNVVGGVGPTRYLWTIDGNPTSTITPLVLTNPTVAPVTYATAGQKNARVAVTKDGGNGLITKFANCKLNVLADPPLEVSSCSVVPNVVRQGVETPVWTLKTTGGAPVPGSTTNQMGYCVFDWWVTDINYTVSAPLIGTQAGAECSMAPVPRPRGSYWQALGSSYTNVSVSSGGQLAGPVQCGPLMIVQ